MYGVGAAFLCLEPEPTQFGRSCSRLWDLGLSEPPKKVAVPQLWYLFLTLFVPGVPYSVPGFLLYVQYVAGCRELNPSCCDRSKVCYH